MYHKFYFEHVLAYERVFTIYIIVSAIFVNINDSLRGLLKYAPMSQWLS